MEEVMQIGPWESYTEKPAKVHLGVKIWRLRQTVIGSDFKILKDDRVVDTKPKYEYVFAYAGGYPEDSIKECIESIDRIRAVSEGCPPEDFAEIMNDGD